MGAGAPALIVDRLGSPVLSEDGTALYFLPGCGKQGGGKTGKTAQERMRCKKKGVGYE